MSSAGAVVRRTAVLTVVELRKVVSTRASRILLASTAALGLLVSSVLTVVAARETGRVDVSAPMLALTLAVSLSVPLVGVMIMTSDWQSREVMTQFLLEPRRILVFASKIMATLALSIVTVALVVALSVVFALCAAVLARLTLVYETAPAEIVPLVATCVVGAVSGAALASAIMSTPIAVFAVVAQTLIINPALTLLPDGLGSYVSSSTPLDFLSGDAPLTPAVASLAIWVLVPFLIGFWRTRRREVR